MPKQTATNIVKSAERLLEQWSGGNWTCRCDPDFSADQCENCRLSDEICDVTQAYLAEHKADDDTPVTWEWLKAVSHDWIAKEIDGSFFGWASFFLVNDKDHQVRLDIVWDGSEYGVTDLVSLEKHNGDSQAVELVNSWVKTRGDVRRLCRALGIIMEERNAESEASE